MLLTILSERGTGRKERNEEDMMKRNKLNFN